jgi:oligopeptide/dipeptide ABC transporter ATP-binding protein
VRLAGGRIELDGEDMLAMSEARREEIRGGRIAMVFQDPMSSLNPVLKIGAQIAETIARHQPSLSREQRMDRAERLLSMVGVPAPRERLDVYPHEMSGGMRQRVLIAMALANNPQVIVADEPTTALDVTVQAQVMDVMRSACEQAGAALVLITHDMGLVAESADRVIVMYAGRIVEEGPVDALFRQPRHPYTSALLSSIPNPRTPSGQELQSIEGEPPNLAKEINGCAFHPRCWLARGRRPCATVRPEVRDLGEGQYSACHFAEEVAEAWRLSNGGVR